MSPRTHPADDMLVAFAAGTLPLGERLVLATHIGVCPTCARTLALAESVGGHLLEALTPAPLRDDALNRALAAIERPAPAPSHAPAPDGWIRTPPEVVEAVRHARRWVFPGAWVAPVSRGPGKARSYLLGVRPGLGLPLHHHDGMEMTLVLKGAFADGDTTYLPGDFIETQADVRHSPGVHGDEECVCLVAAQGPMIALDWVGRIMLAVARV
jgi:putative transcriptional regulator